MAGPGDLFNELQEVLELKSLLLPHSPCSTCQLILCGTLDVLRGLRGRGVLACLVHQVRLEQAPDEALGEVLADPGLVVGGRGCSGGNSRGAAHKMDVFVVAGAQDIKEVGHLAWSALDPRPLQDGTLIALLVRK